MPKVVPTNRFKKLYGKLPANIQSKTKRQIALLREGEKNYPSLQAKKMVNQPDIWEARIDYHYRMTFKIEDNRIILRAVGTHKIYQKP